jgi:hypothetical protein
MRLLERNSTSDFTLTKDFVGDDEVPPYAILSHTWREGEEVTFEDLTNETGKDKPGYEKIRFCGERAGHDGLQYFWVDTCCINKANYTKLSQAINSMFRWYQNAAKCYVYLSDVSQHALDTNETFNQRPWEPNFRKSRWFKRGWTLQELLAPGSVEFFSQECKLLGDKRSLERQIYEITGIAVLALQGTTLSQFSVDERLSWVENRQTKLEEDEAYSLLGIFDVYIPLIYGEGRKNAFKRLQEEIDKHRMVLKMQTTLPLQVERQQPVYFLDACGFHAPFHLEFINSWEAFIAVLDIKFKHRGLRAVENEQYVLEDANCKKVINMARPFDACFFPGQQVNMDACFDEKTGSGNSCPVCQHNEAAALDQAIDW